MREFEENPIFEVHAKCGRKYKIWASGIIEGFGDEYVVYNMVAPLLHTAQGLAKMAVEGGLITDDDFANSGL